MALAEAEGSAMPAISGCAVAEEAEALPPIAFALVALLLALLARLLAPPAALALATPIVPAAAASLPMSKPVTDVPTATA